MQVILYIGHEQSIKYTDHFVSFYCGIELSVSAKETHIRSIGKILKGPHQHGQTLYVERIENSMIVLTNMFNKNYTSYKDTRARASFYLNLKPKI